MPGRCPLHDGAPASAYLVVAATGPQSSCPSLESDAFVKPVSRQGVACAVDGIGVLVHAAKVTASAAPNIREECASPIFPIILLNSSHCQNEIKCCGAGLHGQGGNLAATACDTL